MTEFCETRGAEAVDNKKMYEEAFATLLENVNFENLKLELDNVSHEDDYVYIRCLEELCQFKDIEPFDNNKRDKENLVTSCDLKFNNFDNRTDNGKYSSKRVLNKLEKKHFEPIVGKMATLEETKGIEAIDNQKIDKEDFITPLPIMEFNSSKSAWEFTTPKAPNPAREINFLDIHSPPLEKLEENHFESTVGKMTTLEETIDNNQKIDKEDFITPLPVMEFNSSKSAWEFTTPRPNPPKEIDFEDVLPPSLKKLKDDCMKLSLEKAKYLWDTKEDIRNQQELNNVKVLKEELVTSSVCYSKESWDIWGVQAGDNMKTLDKDAIPPFSNFKYNIWEGLWERKVEAPKQEFVKLSESIKLDNLKNNLKIVKDNFEYLNNGEYLVTLCKPKNAEKSSENKN